MRVPAVISRSVVGDVTLAGSKIVTRRHPQRPRRAQHSRIRAIRRVPQRGVVSLVEGIFQPQRNIPLTFAPIAAYTSGQVDQSITRQLRFTGIINGADRMRAPGVVAVNVTVAGRRRDSIDNWRWC